MTMQWENVRSDFEPDGGLRDIYVRNANAQVWCAFLSKLAVGPFQFRTSHGVVAIKLVSSFGEALRLSASDPVLLQIQLKTGLLLNCHFFCEDEIELDVDPRQVTDGVEFADLLEFVQWLANAVGERVIVTYENSSYEIFACEADQPL